MSKKEKKEKEKVTYYDDGSTISDMSSLRDSKGSLYRNSNKQQASEKEKLKTFFQAFKMMLVPTGVALLVLLILYIIFSIIGASAK